MRGEEEHNEGVPLSNHTAPPFHHLLRGRVEQSEEEAAKRTEDRWSGAAGTDFVNQSSGRADQKRSTFFREWTEGEPERGRRGRMTGQSVAV